jgi:hypothetical protein
VTVTSIKSLRGDIVRRTVNAVQKLILGYSSARPEINHLNDVVLHGMEVDVRGLDITMDDALRVKVSQR